MRLPCNLAQGIMDMLIAAAAKSGRCCLVTNNTAHFALVGGLDIENWTLS